MNVLFLGKDKRYNVVIDYLSNKYNVECIGYENKVQGSLNHIDKYDMIILPMYGIKNGKIDNITITNELINKIKSNCIIYTGIIPRELVDKNVISFMDDPEIVKENNKITVEGMLDSIKDKKKETVCILGYGKIGKMIYEKIKDQSLVIVGVKDFKDVIDFKKLYFLTSDYDKLKKNLSNSDLIINTVPKNIITDDIAQNIKGHILDIASYPYGINQSLVKKYKLDYHLYSSIPSKYDPERAGKILLKKF